MKRIAWLSLIAFTVSATSTVAIAQSAGEPSRAEVKAETRAAEKSRTLIPAGQGVVSPTPSRNSALTRAQRKAQTREARAAGQLEPAGEAADLAVEKADDSRPSTTSRAQRRTTTRQAERAGALIPAGQGPDAPKR